MAGAAPDWLGLLRARTDRFAEVVADADPAALVTYCPGWSLRDLVVHLGGVHQWAAHAGARQVIWHLVRWRCRHVIVRQYPDRSLSFGAAG